MLKNRIVALAVLAAGSLCGSAWADNRVSVTTAGNLFALLPSGDLASSTASGIAFGLPSVDNNLVGSSLQDDGLVFTDTDADQRLAITGFDGALTEIRLFTSPNDVQRVPSLLTIYYSTLSTTSLVSSDAAYTGANGGTLVGTMALTPLSFNHPVAGATNSYLDLGVSAPAGTQSLLIDLGSAVGGGDRVGEVQGFVPEPASIGVIAVTGLIALRRRR